MVLVGADALIGPLPNVSWPKNATFHCRGDEGIAPYTYKNLLCGTQEKPTGGPVGFHGIHFQILLQTAQITVPRAAIRNQTKAVACQPALSDRRAMP